MCTVTLEYNPHNALARRKLAALLATGLFIKKDIILEEPTSEEVDSHRAEMQAFITHSKRSMANIIARYV